MTSYSSSSTHQTRAQVPACVLKGVKIAQDMTITSIPTPGDITGTAMCTLIPCLPSQRLHQSTHLFKNALLTGTQNNQFPTFPSHWYMYMATCSKGPFATPEP